MFEAFVMLLVIVIIFGSMYGVFKMTTRINPKSQNSNIGKVITSFPVGYKMMGHIVKIDENYYFCCEGCGIVKIDYSSNLDKAMASNTFQSLLAQQFAKINNRKSSDEIGKSI